MQKQVACVACVVKKCSGTALCKYSEKRPHLKLSGYQADLGEGICRAAVIGFFDSCDGTNRNIIF